MDDIKVFGASLEHLEQKVSSIQKLSRMIGLEFNDSKSGLLTDSPKSEIQHKRVLRQFPIVGSEHHRAYRYLGFKQTWVNGQTTKDDILVEARKRIRKLAFSKLTNVLMTRLVRVYVSPLVRFVSQSMDWKQSELVNLTRHARVLMKKTGRIPHKLSNGRVHCAESEGGIGLPNFLEEDYLEALAVRRYLLRKEFMEERSLEARTSLGSLLTFTQKLALKEQKEHLMIV